MANIRYPKLGVSPPFIFLNILYIKSSILSDIKSGYKKPYKSSNNISQHGHKDTYRDLNAS